MQFERVYTFMMQKLGQELPNHLTYHNVAHTQEVLQMVQDLATRERVAGADLHLLKTAALFHDSGFLENTENHEEHSCQFARTYLPQYHYSDEQIEAVCRLIMVTKLPQQPTNILERILCDADLSYLGGDRYLQRADALFQELKFSGIVTDWEQWQAMQVQFLSSHHYFTKTAIKKWGPRKSENLKQLVSSNGSGHKHSINIASLIQDSLMIALGVVISGFGLEGFLVPNHFFDGGVTGISLLVHEFFSFNLAILTIVLNIPFIIAGYFVVSKRFAIRTFVAVLLLAACLHFIPYPVITSDKLLISIFGGIFLGLGSGLAMRANSSLDGIEVLALYTLKRTSFTISEIILAANIIIFAIAGLRVGIGTALYSILTYLATTKTIDYVVEGIEAYTGVTIISGNSEVIKARLVNEMGRSITIYKGERGYLPGNYDVSAPVDIIFTVISRLELRKLKNVVMESDPKAFVFANTIREASGGIIKHRHHEH